MSEARRLKVILCGYGHLALSLLEGLLALNDQCEVTGVFRWTARPGGEVFWEPVEDSLMQLVRQAGLFDIHCAGMNHYDFISLLQDLNPDMVLVGSWGEILKPHILEVPGVLMVNCHPSKLPAHRGANPYASVILKGETETGVTFHRMVPEIDAGNILLQATVPLHPDDTGESVRKKCTQAASALVPELIETVRRFVFEHEPLPEVVQDESRKSYYGQLKPHHGCIDWHADPESLYRQMRALYPWVACYAEFPFWFKNISVAILQSQFVALTQLDEKWHKKCITAAKPGTVIGWTPSGFLVSLNSKEYVLFVQLYTFAFSKMNFCPLGWASLLGRFLLREGVQFRGA